MRKDPTAFRERFKKWKEGAKPYQYGIPYEDDSHNVDYDQARANQLGYEKDEKGHLSTRDYETGRFLKSPAHSTVSMGVWGDMNMGYDVWYNQRDKSLYSQPNFTSTYKDRLPKFAGGTEGYKYVQAGKNNEWSRITDDKMSKAFQDLVVRPQSRGGNTTEGNWKRQWSPKYEKPLESVSPEFFVLSGGLSPLTDGIKIAASNAANKTMFYANSKLYSNNPFVNLYATAARRYNLPDKARLPYLIRAIKSDQVALDESGNVVLNGNRFGHTNFTYDRKVVPHSKGSWDNSESTVLVNPRKIVPNTKWGSIEPSDMFTIKDHAKGFVVPKDDVIFISGNPTVQKQLVENGIKYTTSPKIQALEEYQIAREAAADAANKTARFAFNKSDRHLPNREYWDEVFNIQSKFGRPKLKDVRLLERITGMDSGISPIHDLQKFIHLNKNQLQNTPINEIQQLEDTLPVFGNGRRFNFMKNSDYNGVTYPYKNFFYDPATHAESNFVFQ